LARAVKIDGMDLRSVMKQCTNFVIAHRLSRVTQADQVLVVQEGQIVEQGPHQQLIAQQGIYANLYALQLGGAMVERWQEEWID
jgi:ATP-binding cassette, subfamily B, multidrug efflux pump